MTGATKLRIFAVAVLAPAALAAQSQQAPAFRASVDVVELNVAVTDGRRVVADLAAGEFVITDNGVRQPVISAVRERLPIDVTLLLDTSDSVTPVLEKAIASAANRIRGRLRSDDRVSLVAFNHRIREMVPLSIPALVKAMPLDRPQGQTSLNDAIGVVLAQTPGVDRRQMLIVFTDGLDSTSFLTESDVLAIAGRSRTTVFTVSQSGFTASTPQPFFERLAAVTGGFAQIAASHNVTRSTDGSRSSMRITPNQNLLDELFLKAFDDFRASYVVRYNLTGVPREGFHKVSVTIDRPGRNYAVRARTGYWY